MTDILQTTSNVRQGCPLFPNLFILGTEILAARVRQERVIEGTTMFNTESKINQFADDTSLLLKNITSIINVIGYSDSLQSYLDLNSI